MREMQDPICLGAHWCEEQLWRNAIAGGMQCRKSTWINNAEKVVIKAAVKVKELRNDMLRLTLRELAR